MNRMSLIALNEPHSMVAESYKMFRTNLSYMNIDKENKVILFTSSSSEEGKTTSICNTAVSFAQGGKRVLLIECDLRKARVHVLFSMPQIPGLTNALAEKKSLSEMVIAVDELPNLHILPAGNLPPDPAETLSSHALESLVDQARKSYDIVLIDAPPVLAVTDASILSRLADGVILVVAARESKKENSRQAQKALDKVGARILGVLLTKGDTKSKANEYYYRDKQ